MTSLAELTLRTSYHKGRDNIAEAFYLPCMRRASAYDRAVGYFRSTVFIIAWPALRGFVARGGRMRVLCSQVLAPADIEALRSGYAARENDVLASRLLEEVRSLLAEPALRAPARILAALVARGQLELKVALLREGQTRAAEGRIFHDKLGIFRDDQGDAVIFKGSMNETWTGLASDGNLESIDVAATWMGARDLERAKTEDAYFNDLWRNQYPTLDVLPFPKVAQDEFVKAADPDWENTIENLANPSNAGQAEVRTLRPHQAAVLASWAANDRRGIVQLATGSGKTFVAITAIGEAMRVHSEVAIVIVPDRALFQQWERELAPLISELDAHLLRAGAGHDGWRQHLRLWTRPNADKRRIVLATVQTASSDDFMNGLARGSHLFLVADEVHRLGSPHHQRILADAAFGARLGLSATPERAGDSSGTSALLTFFRGVLEPRYTLADAVRDGVLTRYFYRPHVVGLADDEIVAWRELSAQLARLQARLVEAADPGVQNRVKHLLMQRAHIVKQARAKVPLAEDVLQAEYQAGQRWIVYCDDQAQLNSVSQRLSSVGISNTVFHAQMSGDRAETLRWLDREGGVVIAIKCLDEGVDVPSVTHALILASSKNPREFIQRRGRVLRRADNKALAYVHDAIVVPPTRGHDSDEKPMDTIALGELARAVEFAMGADNPASATDLQKIAIDLGLNWHEVTSNGVEDAD